MVWFFEIWLRNYCEHYSPPFLTLGCVKKAVVTEPGEPGCGPRPDAAKTPALGSRKIWERDGGFYVYIDPARVRADISSSLEQGVISSIIFPHQV